MKKKAPPEIRSESNVFVDFQGGKPPGKIRCSQGKRRQLTFHCDFGTAAGLAGRVLSFTDVVTTLVCTEMIHFKHSHRVNE